ncbi:MAG TPA: substrate-binding domain-containing protein [Anaerolineaceae bacterium]|nr:substrate-binding domain-containing protein [Anaerolineaceae bacterium]
MEDLHLYLQIADSIRREIINGKLNPGDKLPSVRESSKQWGCTQGTVQRAYHELSQQGLIDSRAGKGTRVSGQLTPIQQKSDKVIRRASLVNRAEEFLLEVLSRGYSLDEIQTSVDMAMDRWRSFADQEPQVLKKTIKFIGSHDPIINSLSTRFADFFPGFGLKIKFSGSLAGLNALFDHQSDLAGSHLWDAKNDGYNLTQVKKIFLAEKMVLLTLAHRRLGLILPPGNPQKVSSIEDIIKKRIRLANRQTGSGTRIWLDTTLANLGISPDEMVGYDQDYLTHSEIGRVIADGSAGVGIGLESVAIAYGLDFQFLTLERYDLVFYHHQLNQAPFDLLVNWLQNPEGKLFISKFPGYDNKETGEIKYST